MLQEIMNISKQTAYMQGIKIKIKKAIKIPLNEINKIIKLKINNK